MFIASTLGTLLLKRWGIKINKSSGKTKMFEIRLRIKSKNKITKRIYQTVLKVEITIDSCQQVLDQEDISFRETDGNGLSHLLRFLRWGCNYPMWSFFLLSLYWRINTIKSKLIFLKLDCPVCRTFIRGQDLISSKELNSVITR